MKDMMWNYIRFTYEKTYIAKGHHQRSGSSESQSSSERPAFFSRAPF